MRIVKTTDGKYIGRDININIKVGMTVDLGDFEFYVQKLTNLDNNQVSASNPNYQIIFEEQ